MLFSPVSKTCREKPASMFNTDNRKPVHGKKKVKLMQVRKEREKNKPFKKTR